MGVVNKKYGEDIQSKKKKKKGKKNGKKDNDSKYNKEIWALQPGQMMKDASLGPA